MLVRLPLASPFQPGLPSWNPVSSKYTPDRRQWATFFGHFFDPERLQRLQAAPGDCNEPLARSCGRRYNSSGSRQRQAIATGIQDDRQPGLDLIPAAPGSARRFATPLRQHETALDEPAYHRQAVAPHNLGIGAHLLRQIPDQLAQGSAAVQP